jgi:hypothetical protein
MLLEKGADPSLKDNMGNSALTYAELNYYENNPAAAADDLRKLLIR